MKAKQEDKDRDVPDEWNMTGSNVSERLEYAKGKYARKRGVYLSVT